MTIIEDINYSIEDVIDQIKETFGFIYTRSSDTSGFILLGSGVRLEIEFKDEGKGLESALIKFPRKEFDLAESSAMADLYSSCIESAVQIVDLINRMIGGGKKTDDQDS